MTDQVSVALAGRGRWGEEQGIVWRLDQDPTSVPRVRVAGAGAEARRDIDEVPLVGARRRGAHRRRARAARIAARPISCATPRACSASRGITDRVIDRVARGVRLAAQRELIAIDDDRARMRD